MQLLFGILLMLAGMVATTIGGFMAKDGWEKIQKSNKISSSPSPPNVTSINQQGGITAGTINNYNATNIQRSLPLDSSDTELSKLSNVSIYLHWQADDKEAVTFKDNLGQYLADAGLNVTQSVGHSNDNSIQNLILDINSTHPESSNIVIAAKMLKRIFDENNIKSSIVKSPDNQLTENQMYIRIGAIQQTI
ncbi:hypothetical protein MNBD_ALPHA04-2097 [hydrothermal vent metagenome]|uniref:Uncharacterized protein n=1 Tax=hydrothermal vent metagenome TaxID=652676 RepID=A0A3B0SI50_9ZZZZ